MNAYPNLRDLEQALTDVIIFHSVHGIRTPEKEFAARLRSEGHRVKMPDLYGGEASDNLEEGFQIKARIGWDAICERAWAALAETPQEAVLLGISMGTGVVAEMWSKRPLTTGVVLLHGLAALPGDLDQDVPVHVHVSDNDPFFPPTAVFDWERSATSTNAKVHVVRHRGCGHYFSDPTSPDYEARAASILWRDLIAFLETRC